MNLDNLNKWKYRLKTLLKESKSNEDILKELDYVNEQIRLLTEDEGGGGGVATANAGNVCGMGAVVSAQPGAMPGTTGTTGSGDYGNGLYPTQKQSGLGNLFKKISKSRKKKGQKALLSFSDYTKRKKNKKD